MQREPFLQITEIFHSLQGETSLSGLRFAFIRLTGCNLRCSYCDSVYAFKGGTKKTIPEILETIAPWNVQHVLVTGGEPLMQRYTPELVQALIAANYRVSIETHGEADISKVAKDARIVLDVKTPGSKMNRGYAAQNLHLLKPGDEVKFVLTSKSDYAFARDFLKKHPVPDQVEVLFSPVVDVKGRFSTRDSAQEEKYTLQWLAESIIQDQLNVRMQTQLHKMIWGAERTGV